jgi:transcriptional regulator with XRE-family HTH domain
MSGAQSYSSASRPDSIDRELGHRLRLRREMLGLTQEAFGDLVGLSAAQIHKYENGISRVTLWRAIHLCNTLGVPMRYFTNDLTTNESIPIDMRRKLDAPHVAELLELWSETTDPARAGLLEFLRAYRKKQNPKNSK